MSNANGRNPISFFSCERITKMHEDRSSRCDLNSEDDFCCVFEHKMFFEKIIDEKRALKQIQNQKQKPKLFSEYYLDY